MTWFEFNFNDFTISFLSLLLESVPYLLLGSLISGFVEVFVPATTFDRLLPKRPPLGVLLAGAIPLVLPMCECGVVPVIRRLMRKGLPPAYAITYMLAAPIVNPVVAMSTFAAFSGGEFFNADYNATFYAESSPVVIVIYRLFLGYGIAVGCGMLALAFKPESYLQPSVLKSDTTPTRTGVRTLAAGDDGVATLSPAKKTLQSFGYAANDFVEIAAFLVMGCAITAVFNTSVNQDVILPLALEPWRAIAAMLVLAFVLALCSTSDAFIAATFLTFPMAARMGFLVFGPIYDIKLIFLYSLVFRKRIVAGFGLGLFVVVMVICERLLPYLQ